MFQLYKQRDFSTYISDTINFFKTFWKNYFSNYIIIAGGVIALLSVFYFFFFRDLFSSIFSTANDGISYDISYFFNNNPVLFLSLFGIVLIISIIFSFFCISYPIVYLRMFEETGRSDFSTAEIIDRIKSFLPKIIRFSLLSLVTFIPIIAVAVLLASVLVLIIIGVFILIILVPAFSVWIMQSQYVYLLGDMSFREAMKEGWRILFSKKFWHIIGSTLVVYVILNIIQSIITMVPYLILIFSFLSTGSGQMNDEAGVYMSILYVVSLIVSYISFNIMVVNQGLIHYSAMEHKNQTQILSEIESIGRNAD